MLPNKNTHREKCVCVCVRNTERKEQNKCNFYYIRVTMRLHHIMTIFVMRNELTPSVSGTDRRKVKKRTSFFKIVAIK